MPRSLRMVSFSASFCWLGWITPLDIFSLYRFNLPKGIQSGEKRENVTNLPQPVVRTGNKEGSRVVYADFRFLPCSDVWGQQLPVLHPTVSLPLCVFFFFFGHRDEEELSWFFEAGSRCVQGCSLIVKLRGSESCSTGNGSPIKILLTY